MILNSLRAVFWLSVIYNFRLKAKIPLTRYAEAACVMHHQTKMEMHVNE